MSSPLLPNFRSHLTLVLCTILHAFTHAYGTILVPLYLLIAADMRLSGVKLASLIVTVYGVVYCIFSFWSGKLADRGNRKWLLGIGLVGNGLAILMIGLSRRYELLILWAVVAGISGTLFHPAVSTLVPAHYPKSPGMAIGLLGIGSGIGFFAGPQFAGWRAQSAQWHWQAIADWQRPCVEMGIAGIVVGFIFLLLAKEVHRSAPQAVKDSSNPSFAPPATAPGHGRLPLPAHLRRGVIVLSMVLGCRDFAGVATVTLASLYLQKAHGKSPKEAGFILGAMMLLSVIVNPMAVWLSAGKRRLPGLSVLLVVGGLILSTTSHWPAAWALTVLCAFQTCQLGSYAVSDAAMLERVDPAVRGRVVGLFLSLAGTFASLSPWVMGFWVDALGQRSHDPAGYAVPFATLGALMMISSFCTPIIARLGQVSKDHPINPLSEVSPATVELGG